MKVGDQVFWQAVDKSINWETWNKGVLVERYPDGWWLVRDEHEIDDAPGRHCERSVRPERIRARPVEVKA